MAYEIIGRYDVYDYTHESGGFNIRMEAVAKQEILKDVNRSRFYIELLAHFKSESASFNVYKSDCRISYLTWDLDATDSTPIGDIMSVEQIVIQPGDEITQVVATFDTDNYIFTLSTKYNKDSYIKAVHNLDGSFPANSTGHPLIVYYNGYAYEDILRELYFYFHTYFDIRDINVNGTDYDDVDIDKINHKSTQIYLEPIGHDRTLSVESAVNFTDEENPSFSYNANITEDDNLVTWYDSSGAIDFLIRGSTITSLQVALSIDGVTPDIAYRSVSLSDTTYTFNLTEEERELLRVKAKNSTTIPIYYLLKSIREYSSLPSKYQQYQQQVEGIGVIQKTLTIVGCYPSVNPQLRDVNSDTVALTGDEKKFIRYESMAEFSTEAVASKHAEIVSQSVQCGSKVVYDSFYGVIDDVESGTFVFNVVDSRNLQSSTTVVTDIVEYVKPTCKQDVKINITATDDADATVTLKVSGAYFGGSFGVVDNTLLLEVRHTDDSGTMGDWEVLDNPNINVSGNTYELTKTYSNFRSDRNYVFQCRATDKLNVVQTAQYTVTSSSVFDWGEEDFNFNVPINMHGKTIIRHNAEANNTVLSASGGHIYIRPGGTDNTSGEIMVYPDGRVKFNNEVEFADGSIGGGSSDADYVVEIGSEAMGTNGTWYWRKWNSGKAECWGCRNFGTMLVNNAWGSLYTSAVFTQDLPQDVFKTTPDAININFVHTNAGGWISKYENTAPSAITTGSFVVVRPESGNITPTNIGFYIIGEWK